ncbi:MAG TPA: DoxX family protein [Candidatus Nanoarchaeia archaeon]|nr:DoxX family protein [Candidatus Nanoarchaeia archaeon]
MLWPGFENYGLLALRIAVGTVFFYHGTNKIKKWSSLPGFMRFIGISEVLGSIAVALGFLTQIAGIGLAIIMAGATYKKIKEWNVPYSSDSAGWELDVTLLLIALALVLLGAGTLSIDSMASLWP